MNDYPCLDSFVRCLEMISPSSGLSEKCLWLLNGSKENTFLYRIVELKVQIKGTCFQNTINKIL